MILGCEALGVIDVVAECFDVGLLSAEPAEPLHGRVAVRAVAPGRAGPPLELGELGLGAQRVAGVEECLQVDSVVDGRLGDGHRCLLESVWWWPVWLAQTFALGAGEPLEGGFSDGTESPYRVCMLQVGVLGPLLVERDGANVVPSSPKPRALLIDLLLHCGETITRDRIIDDLWGEQPPATAAGVVQNYVSQLRRYLGADVVATTGQGYALVAELVTTDIAEFEAHLERARSARDTGALEEVQRATTDALALWRGEPLADVAFESFAQAEIARLRELRALAFELRFEAVIAAGRHHDAVAGLEAAVVADPLRERLWWLLMLALYRSGRQADALRAFQRARGLLAEELGLAPGVELRELERAILDQRADIDQLLTGSLPRPRTRRRNRTRPTMLGRTEEWARIEAFLDRADEDDGGLLLLTGEPGIGKTRLLDEARVLTEASGGTVLFGHGFEAERGRAYGAWVDVLRGAAIPELDRAQKAVLASLIPEVSEDVAQLDDPSRLYDAVAYVLASMAGRAPLVVLLDDLHWVDEQSLALLHFAVRHLADVARRVVPGVGPWWRTRGQLCLRTCDRGAPS